jgi:hypothetical protein
MKRRQVLAALGAASSGGALLTGTGAFTSVSADRTVSVAVASDTDALLRLAPCKGSKNGDYVTGASNGALSVDLSESNENVLGDGANADATTVIDDIFEICNQGTQPVGVWLETNPVQNGNGNDAVSFYRDSDQSAPVTTQSNALCLDTGECICVGLVARTHGIDPDDYTNLFQPVEGANGDEMIVNAVADVACSEPVSPPNPEPRRLDTGSGLWEVKALPSNATAPEQIPYTAKVIEEPPSAWDTSNSAEWVDPFGTGGLQSDPASHDEPYVYELEFDVQAGSRQLIIEEYGADNPVEFFLGENSIGGYSGEKAYSPLRDNISAQSVLSGNHTLRAEVFNQPGSGNNPTGLYVAARLE